MPTFDSMRGESNEFEPKEPRDYSSSKTNSNLLVAKVFGIMFIGLLITALIAGGLGFTLSNMLQQAIDASDEALMDNILNFMLVSMLISGVGLIIMSIVVPMVFARGKHSILVPLIIYIILMGVLLSSFTMAIDWWILAESALITGITFGSISLIGLLGKGKIPGLALTISGLFIGILLLSLMNLILWLTGVGGDGLSWIISFLFLALVMFISIWDVRNIKNIAARGFEQENNVILYCAYTIYSDVIAIFVRIAVLLSRLKRK